MKKLKVIDLFAGVGGFSLGFQQAGMEIVAHVEKDKHAKSILEKHFPNALSFDDVREVGKHNLPKADVICGGFPCQDVSVAGKGKGIQEGTRSGLWFEFKRIVDEMRPQWVIIENVKGLLSNRHAKGFYEILKSLDEFGYGVSWRVLNSRHFNVAQRRERVFVVASLGDLRSAEVLFESESMSGDIDTSKETEQSVARGIEISSGEDCKPKGYRLVSFGEYAEDDSASTLKQRDYKDATDLITFNVIAQDDGRNNGRGGLTVEPTDVSLTIGSKGKTLMVDTKRVWQMNHADEVYRDCGADVAPTLQSRMGTGGNNIPLVGVRKLTPTECEVLQGFPKYWSKEGIYGIISDTQRYKQMGNAVTVNVARWIGERIINA